MLEMLERYIPRIRAARAESDILEILTEIASGLGYRSAYVVEYKSKLSGVAHAVDSDLTRGEWWEEYFNSRLRHADPQADKRLLVESVIYLDTSRFENRPEGFGAFAAKYDFVNGAVIPIIHEGTVVGAVGFSGEAKMDLMQERAIMFIAYGLYAQVRSLKSRKPNRFRHLTAREREVMKLSAEGLTSEEIAKRLGMAARTVNQHVDNVAEKLGTRNRTHTVAEAIRNNLLN